jgi:hypothetical protein
MQSGLSYCKISPDLAMLEGGNCTDIIDLYRRLWLQFSLLLMMGAVDTRNMYGDFAVK